MADNIISIASKVAEYLVAPIGRRLGYLFNYHSNLDDLKIQLEKLEDVKIEVKQDVVDSTRNGEEIKPVVEKWLRSVDGITEKAGEILLENEDKAKKRCLNGLCPNLKSRYQLSKKAKKTTKEVVKIQDGGKFERVSNHPAPQGTISSAPIKGYVDFESRMSTLKEIMEALGNPDINMIGVYGMGGVGKTMLVKEVARKAKEDNLFVEVGMAVVSQPPDIRKIQEEIARPLGLKFEPQEIDSERAGRLCGRLKQEKSILIILDDIWAQLDLEAVGIPSVDIHKGCKIVVTSRRQDLLSNQMNIKNNFEIGQLPEEEAWNLFKKTAGDSVEAPEIKPTALEVAKECAGLPIAIAVVATALKNKIPSVWNNSLYHLKKSAPTTIEGMNVKVYSSLKLSYDFLESEAQKLFLLCSLLPEDYQFSIQDLLYFGKGVGLFQGMEALEIARDSVHALVDRLKASCLLLDGDTSGLFKMHDVVRDVGIFVASKDEQMLIVRNSDELDEWMTEEKLKVCSALSLPYTEIHELPTRLESPQLKFFLFFSKDSSSKIPDTFYEEMKQLKVLTLRNMHFSSLPSSLHFLSSLQTLCLNRCQLGDISIIGELKKLEILSFGNSNIEELPSEIGQLTHLKLLDLRDCGTLVIPPHVIASLSRLEELYMGGSFNRWEVDGNASLAELKHLSRLVTLEIDIRDANILPNDLEFEKLTRYKILIGDFRYFLNRSDDYEISRTILKIKVNTSIDLLSGIKKLLKRTEDLHLEELNGFKSILNDSDGEGFHDTRRLHVESSSEIEYVIDTSVPFSTFPKLESLWLEKLINLKEICHGQLTAESFCNLRKVHVWGCDRLQNLFPLSVARRLSKLQEIDISFCKNMDGIVAEGREAAEDNNGAVFPQLRSLELNHLPELVSFCSKVKAVPCTSDAGSKEIISISEGEHGISIPLFNEKDTFPNLEILVIKYISMKEIWHSQLLDASFCNLRKVIVFECDGLQNLFSLSVARRLSKLQEISISFCKNVDGIVAEGREAAEDNNRAVFPQLRSLRLYYLPELVSFCSKVKAVPYSTSDAGSKEIISISEGEHGISIPLFNEKDTFPNLEILDIANISMKEIWHSQLPDGSFCNLRKVEVSGCDRLQNLFPLFVARWLSKLQEIHIQICKNMDGIVAEGREAAEDNNGALFPQLRSLKLVDLPELVSFCSKVKEVPCSTSDAGSKEIISISEGEHGISIPLFNQKDTFPNLKILYIRGRIYMKEIWHSQLPDGSFCNLRKVKVDECNRLQNLFPLSVARRLSKLKEIEIDGCSNMDGIVAEGREAAEDNNVAVFPQLRSLSLYRLPELVSFCSKVKAVPCSTSDAGSKEIISISEGEHGISIPLFNQKVAFPNLEKLDLEDLPRLMAVWMKDSQGSLNFQKLSSLNIRNCESLINVFTTSMAQFQDMVEEINEKEAAAIDKIMFPQVKSLTFECLKQLKSLCEWNHISEWPSLEYLEMSECDNVEIFASELSTSKETRGKANLGTPTKQPLFLVDKVAFPNLEEMELNDMSSMEVIWQGQFHAQSSFCKLRVLRVKKCSRILKVFPISLLRNLHNLEELSVKDCCSLEDVFELEGGVGKTEHASTFPPLKELRLIRLPKLMHLWKEDSQLSAVFQNLKTLEVKSCGSLTYVFPSTRAESPVQIERTTDVSDKGKATDETTFSQLYSLRLKYLSNLTSFCPGSKKIFLPSLEKVLVEECPKLKTFSSNTLHTPKLEKVLVTEDKRPLEMNEWLWDGDLNTTIQHLFKQKMESGVWSNDPASQLEATTQFRKLLSIEHSPPIDEVIKAGVIPRFVEFLGRQDLPQLQLEAAWALTNVASGTAEHTRVVIELGAVPKFVQLLSSANDDVREQAVWALGNVAGDSSSYRDLVLGHGALMPLLAQLNIEHSKLSMLRNATWTLSNFCRGPFEQVKPALPVLRQLIHLNDEEVLRDACWALSYLSGRPNYQIQAVIEAGVCPRLMELLRQPSPTVLEPALRTVGNIVWRNDTQIQFVIDNQVLPCLYQLLTQNLEKSITREACRTIANITTGNRDQIQAVIEANIIRPLVHQFQHEEFDIKEEAGRAILNATWRASHEQIQFLVSQGCIKPLCDLLVCPDPRIVTVCLRGLENILKVSEADKEMGLNGGINLYAQMIDECKGLDKLENLQTHDNNEISEKAVELLGRYWAEKDDEVQNPKDGENGNQQGFGFGTI